MHGNHRLQVIQAIESAVAAGLAGTALYKYVADQTGVSAKFVIKTLRQMSSEPRTPERPVKRLRQTISPKDKAISDFSLKGTGDDKIR